jgi:hypothetical protein
MRSLKLALGFVLTASVAAAQSYPSPTFSGVRVIGPTTGTTGAFNLTQTLTGSNSGAINPNTITCTNDALSLGDRGVASWCLSVNSVANSGSLLGAVGSLSLQTTLATPSANGAGGGYYVPLATNAQANSGDGGAITTLSATATSGSNTVLVTSATNIAIGDYVLVMLNSGFYQNTTVSNVSGTTITLGNNLLANANSGNSFVDAKGGLQGAILQSNATANAKALYANIGASAAAYSSAGSTSLFRANLTIENDVPFDQAAIVDTMLTFLAQTGTTATSNYGILMSDFPAGKFPLGASSSFIKIGGLYAANSTAPTIYTISNFADLSTLNVAENVLSWHGGGVDGVWSITGAGAANLNSFSLVDPNASITGGGAQRMLGDGAGSMVWQINTASDGKFGTSTTSYKITPTGKLNVIQGLQFQGTDGFTGVKVAGSCTFNIYYGIVVSVTGC